MVLVATTMVLTMETTMVHMVPTMERTMRTMVMGQLHIMQIMELLAIILFNTLLFRQAQSSTTLSTGKFLDMILLLQIRRWITYLGRMLQNISHRITMIRNSHFALLDKIEVFCINDLGLCYKL